MGIVVLPALFPDIPEIYEIYFSAFKNEEMGRIMVEVLFPNGVSETEGFRKAHAESTSKYWQESKIQHTIKCVDSETGEIVGMGLGDTIFKERSEEERRNMGISWLEGKDKERAEKILNPLWEVREKLWAGRRHIYCHVMAVSPEHQGRKAGAALVKWVINLGEDSGLPVYFESSPSTVGLYQKMGFERLNESVIHKAEVLGTENDIEVPLMVRFPSSAGNITFDEWRREGYPANYRKSS